MAIEGIDVSHYQGDIDWEQVAKSGRKSAYVKATDGPVWEDPTFGRNRTGAKKAGLIVGVYHFARFGADPQAQAAFFKQIVGSTDGELPPAVDLEPTSFDPAPRSDLNRPLPPPHPWNGTPNEWLREFDAAVHRELGRHPVLYFPTSFWTEHMNSTSSFDKRHAWFAEWVPPPPPRRDKSPSLPAGWTTWTFWQYTDVGHVPGISSKTYVDLDIFNGDLKALQDLVG